MFCLTSPPDKTSQGNIISVAGIGQDITGRLAQERKYRLIDMTSSPIFGVDMLGRVKVCNECANRLIGHSTEKVMG